jgi:hypothetical protein
MAFEIILSTASICVALVASAGWIRAFASYRRYRAAREAAAIRRMIRNQMIAIASNPSAPERARNLAARDAGVWASRKTFCERAAEWKRFSELSPSQQAEYEREGNAIRDALSEEYRQRFDRLYDWANIASCLEDESPRLYEEALKLVRLHRREQRQQRIIHSLRPSVSVAVELAFGEGGRRDVADKGYVCA